MAMTASKGPDEEVVFGRAVRSVVEEARRSVAEGPPVEVCWICEAEMTLHVTLSEVALSNAVCLSWTCWDTEGCDLPLRRNRQLIGSRAALHDDVSLLDAASKKLLLCATNKRLNDRGVPSGMDDGDAQARAVVLLGSGTLQ